MVVVSLADRHTTARPPKGDRDRNAARAAHAPTPPQTDAPNARPRADQPDQPPAQYPPTHLPPLNPPTLPSKSLLALAFPSPGPGSPMLVTHKRSPHSVTSPATRKPSRTEPILRVISDEILLVVFAI